MEQNEKTKDFIRKAREIHGDTYDYSKVEYINNLQEVVIICNEHGDFLQLPKTHKRGNGCKKCGIINSSNNKRSNKEDFIKKAREVHGNTYDYSKSEYINSKEKVIIICKEHGDFLQTPTDHYNGGCMKCGVILRCEKRTFTKEEIIQNAIEVHGYTYDYSYIHYNNGIIENINCKKHGLFSQLKHIHINKKGGCKKCSDKIRGENRKITTEEFIERSNKIHEYTFDYSKSEYTGIYDKITIICKTHGEFLQKANDHLHGNGCAKCYNERRSANMCLTKDEIIKKAIDVHGDIYDYSKLEYINCDTNVIIICKEHGEFQQRPFCHINKQNCCPLCSNIKRAQTKTWTNEQFIENAQIIHNNKYNYTKTNYTKTNENVIIICKKHGEFQQRPSNHLQGQGCPLCVNKTEAKLYEKLITIYPTLQTQFKQDWCKRITYLPYDFCIPEYKIIIELDGEQHFRQVSNWSSPEDQQENDKFKETCANGNGYSIIRLLQEDVFYDTYDWIKELCGSIEEIIKTNEITNIYLCQNNEYNNR